MKNRSLKRRAPIVITEQLYRRITQVKCFALSDKLSARCQIACWYQAQYPERVVAPRARITLSAGVIWFVYEWHIHCLWNFQYACLKFKDFVIKFSLKRDWHQVAQLTLQWRVILLLAWKGTYHFLWGGGVWRFYRGGHIFSEPKKGGSRFFQSSILNIFLKKVCHYQKSECKLYYWATVCFTFKYGLAKILFNT